MIANVSSAAPDRRAGRAANCARSIASVYSARVRICQPPPISTSSTPWPSTSYDSRISSSAACSSAGDASDSSVASSSVAIGRALANSAASSSFASGVTRDFHVGEWFGLRHFQLTELRQLQEAKKRRKNLPGLGVLPNDLRPEDARFELEHRANNRDGAGDVDGARN